MKSKRDAILLVISSLGAGGAERVMSTMANYWAMQGRQVHLITTHSQERPPFYALHGAILYLEVDFPAIERRSLPRLRKLSAVLALRRAIRSIRPQVVVAFGDQTNAFTILAAVGLRIPVIVSERYDPHANPIPAGWELFRRWIYPWAASVVTQTDGALRYFPPKVQRRGRVIANPIDERVRCIASERRPRSGQTLIAMGRLVPQKGFELLLTAFSRVAPQHLEWTLEIWGDGPLRNSLESLVERLGLQDRVRMPGITKEPWQKMREADLFVLSSRFEGFPNVLCEAMACGLPVISFDCPSGPSEIIRDGIDGVLVPAGDEAALAAAIARLMDHPEERERLAARAPEVLDRFGLERVMGTWDALIDEVRA